MFSELVAQNVADFYELWILTKLTENTRKTNINLMPGLRKYRKQIEVSRRNGS